MTFDSPVRIGVQVQPQHATYQTIRDTVLRIEDLGADVVFNWDHFFPLSGEPDGLHFEAWTMLGAWAEQTERIEFGCLVGCNSYRNADLQADMARTIDHISAKGSGVGRFVFGTGAGWFERDYDEYGYEFGTPGTRLNALAGALPRVRDRWAKLNPPPTRDIPIMIGGKGEQKTLRIVAEHADIWHSFVQPDEIAHKLDVLRRWGDEVGRDVSQITVSNELGRRGDDERAEALHAAGTRLFTVGISGPDYDLAPVEHWLAWRDAKNG
ncbi:LLM class F420-dependent oxidoreductase [Agromyces intestinalis]|uniref:LLM class F420-dependent oxidoreductase n=1 Tax=Agromyces intestinalis TaxID=2592652 RepID=A0A5C1YF45_9MICO|nr:LLM class F420-dependent oxidoreductase [Agromyces intestinalis]QEO14278.1 LLM class F420-dependent oxidoreductase [Agromyces intestinalis]